MGGSDADTFNVNTSMTAVLQGGAGDDRFVFANGAALTGSIDGGAGSDELDFSANTSSLSLTLTGPGGTDGVVGSGSSISGFNNIDTITGGSGADTFTVTGGGTVSLAGNAGDDTFNLGGGLTGTVSGGAGNDTFNVTAAQTANLFGDAGNDVFNLSADVAGTVDGGADADTFNVMTSVTANLQGGAGNDAFVFGDGVVLTGVIDGGAGNDRLDFSANVAGVNLTLTGAGATDGVTGTTSQVTGGFGNIDTLIGGAGADTFTINASGAAVLLGGAGADRFVFANGAVLTGSIDGGAGSDELDFSANTSGLSLTLTGPGSIDGVNGTGSSITSGFSNIDTITGGSGADTFTVTGGGTANLAGNGGDDTFNLGAGLAGTVSGGAGNDTFNVTAAQAANLFGDAGNDVFNLSANVTGTVDGGAGADTFNVTTNVTGNLQGGAGDDTFVFANGVVLTGNVDGGSGKDTLDHSAASSLSVTLTGLGPVDGFDGTQAAITGGFTNIDAIIGNGTSTLIGANVNSTWNLGNTSQITAGGQSIEFEGFRTLRGGSGNDSVQFTGTPSGTGDFSFDGGAGSNPVAVNGPVNLGAGKITLLNVGPITQTAAGVLSASLLTIESTGGVELLTAANQLQSILVTNQGGGSVRVRNAGTMTANVSNAGVVDVSDTIELVVGGSGDLLIGTLTSDGDFKISAGGNILATGSGTQFVGGPLSQAVLQAGNSIGIQVDPVEFAGFSSQLLPGRGAPIVLIYPASAFINTLSGALVDDQGGRAINSFSVQSAVLGQSDAASREDATDIDWAAYSKDIRLYSINNEGVQQPEDQRLDEFVQWQRWMRLFADEVKNSQVDVADQPGGAE